MRRRGEFAAAGRASRGSARFILCSRLPGGKTSEKARRKAGAMISCTEMRLQNRGKTTPSSPDFFCFCRRDSRFSHATETEPGRDQKKRRTLAQECGVLGKKMGAFGYALRRFAEQLPSSGRCPAGFAPEKTYLMFLGLTSSGIFKTSFTLMKSGFEILLK